MDSATILKLRLLVRQAICLPPRRRVVLADPVGLAVRVPADLADLDVRLPVALAVLAIRGRGCPLPLPGTRQGSLSHRPGGVDPPGHYPSK